jgi:YggT family protein
MSWFPLPQNGIIADVVGAIDSLVSPFINLFRRFIPPFAGLDFSPILAIVVLRLIERFVVGILP